MSRRHRLIALLTGASPSAVRPPNRLLLPGDPDPYLGALTAPDLPQQLREKGAI